MNTHAFTARRAGRSPADPTRYARRRLSSLVIVVGAAAGAVVVGLLADHGAPVPLALIVGIGLFLAVVAFATNAAWRVRFDTRESPTRRARDHRSSSLRDLAAAYQLGPDPEQVIGRQTGTRA